MKRRPRENIVPQRAIVFAVSCCMGLLLTGNATLAVAQTRRAVQAVPPTPEKKEQAIRRTVTIDLQRVLAEFQPFQNRLREVQEKDAERRTSIKQMEKEDQKIEGRQRQFVFNSQEHAEHSRRLFKAQAELAAAQQEADYELNRSETELYVFFYRLIEKEIGEYALRQNIGIVLNRPPPKQVPEKATAEALFDRFVAYEHNADITDEILLQLSGR